MSSRWYLLYECQSFFILYFSAGKDAMQARPRGPKLGMLCGLANWMETNRGILREMQKTLGLVWAQ